MFQPCVQIFRRHFTPVLNNKMYIVPPSFVETYLKLTNLYNFDHNFRFTAYTALFVPSCFHMHPESPTLIRDMAKIQSATTARSLRWLNVCLRLCGQKGTVEGTALNWWHSSGHYEADRRPAHRKTSRVLLAKKSQLFSCTTRVHFSPGTDLPCGRLEWRALRVRMAYA